MSCQLSDIVLLSAGFKDFLQYMFVFRSVNSDHTISCEFSCFLLRGIGIVQGLFSKILHFNLAL